MTDQPAQKQSLWHGVKNLGINSVLSFLFTFFVFGLINTIALATTIYVLHDFSLYWIALIAVIIVGILFTILGFNMTLKYVIIRSLKLVYNQLEAFFRKFCVLVIDKVSSTATDTVSIDRKHIDKAFDIGNIFYGIYGRSVPRFIQWIIKFVLRRIPFLPMLDSISEVIKSGDKEEASELLFRNVDLYIKNNIFNSNTMNWLYWLLPLNLIAQAAVILGFHYFLK